MADVLPDVLQPNLRLIICGSAAGTVSARRGAYYAHQRNRFWPILADTGLTPRRLAPSEFPLLTGFGIGLTDITKTEFGSDADLTSHDTARLRAALARCRPAVVAFNGKRAASLGLDRPSGALAYGRQAERFGGAIVFVLPSTSPLAIRWWDDRPWYDLADAVRQVASSRLRNRP